MNKRFVAAILGRAIACVLILAAGVGVFTILQGMREQPAQAEIRERAIRVTVQPAVFEDVTVTIAGFGSVRARDTVVIAPEVPGRIVEIHPRLEAGEVIPAGELLFQIDPRDYEARFEESLASIAKWEATVNLLQKQFAIDAERLKTLERSRDLAQAEYERVKSLFEQDQVGTQSGVDQAERSYNTVRDQADQLAQAVSMYPLRIREAESTLASMQAMSKMAQANVERTVVRASFNARVKEVRLERGQYVSPGMNVLTLADDSILEISVPLDSREARDWLRFGGPKDAVADAGKAWFDELERVPVDVFWTEDREAHKWRGTLDRVEKFDQETRTLTVVVRVEGAEVLSQRNGSLPLVEGMFCRVVIPGRVAHRVVQLPAACVGFDKDPEGYRTVYVARRTDSGELRLRTTKVKESHVSGEFVYVSEGLDPGDLVITTRLVNPLENTLLDVEGAPLEGVGL